MEQPQKIGRYIIQSLLGEGAMGSVYKAIDPAIKRTVAIKTIKLDKSRSQEEQDEFLQRFFQEAQISGNLNHPNIVAIYDIGDEAGVPYLALEYVEGKTLNQLIKGSVRPGFESLAKAIVQVANALTFAHRKGIVHRDLKPSNIMITPEGEAKIMDFGIAKMSGSNLTQTGIFLGTPSYSSPEQVREGRVDHRSDIFSLGILAHEVLTGFNPFPGKNISTILYKIANEAPEPPSNLSELPVNQQCWEKVFGEVLDKTPEKRIQNASLFGQRLLKCINLSESTSAELNSFLEEGPTTIRQTIGVDKQIKRSDFEQDKPRLSSVKQKKEGHPFLWSFLVLVFLAVGTLALDHFKIIPEPYRVSQFFPGSIRARFFTPAEVSCNVVISSDPSEARVFIDDLEIATTPSTYKYQGAPEKSITVTVQKEGYETYRKTITVLQDPEIQLHVPLKALPIKGLITSIPEGASLKINKTDSGKTPLKYSFVLGKSYQITYSKTGYNEKTISFDPAKDHIQKLMVTLKKYAPPGTVEIISEMKNLSVVMNGRKMKRRTSLPAGKYKIQLKNPGVYYRETRWITVNSGQSNKIYTPPVFTVRKIDFKTASIYAMLKIDGIQVDYTPIGALKITKGLHTFKFLDDNGKIIYQMQKEVMDDSEIIVPL